MSDTLVTAAATVRMGRLVFDDRDCWRGLVRGLTEGLRVWVRVDLIRDRRSLSQNAWYWAAIVPAVGQHLSKGRELELHPDQVHYLLKSAFLGVDETPMGPVPKRSRDLTTAAFSAYCEEIRAHAASEWGLPIPGPEEF